MKINRRYSIGSKLLNLNRSDAKLLLRQVASWAITSNPMNNNGNSKKVVFINLSLSCKAAIFPKDKTLSTVSVDKINTNHFHWVCRGISRSNWRLSIWDRIQIHGIKSFPRQQNWRILLTMTKKWIRKDRGSLKVKCFSSNSVRRLTNAYLVLMCPGKQVRSYKNHQIRQQLTEGTKRAIVKTTSKKRDKIIRSW
jgi:hypothetical protein